MRKTVAIIYGGRSAEHKISKISGKSIAANLDKEKFTPREILIDKKGKWFVGNKEVTVVEALKNVDIAFPVMHGTFGEDGKIQGLFEMLNLPFVGCGVTESVEGMDKEISKTIWKEKGLQVTKFFCLKKHDWGTEKDKQVEIVSKLKLPFFVKPAVLGSSIGIIKVKKLDELEKAIKQAFEYGEKILVEEGVEPNRDVQVSLIGNDKVEVSTVGEIIPANEFYDYNAKYENENSKLVIPAPLDSTLAIKIQNTAIKAYQILGLHGFARADFLLKKNTDDFFISEVNTIPGFTPISMYPKLWEHDGVGYQDLITRLIELGFEKYKEKLNYKV